MLFLLSWIRFQSGTIITPRKLLEVSTGLPHLRASSFQFQPNSKRISYVSGCLRLEKQAFLYEEKVPHLCITVSGIGSTVSSIQLDASIDKAYNEKRFCNYVFVCFFVFIFILFINCLQQSQQYIFLPVLMYQKIYKPYISLSYYVLGEQLRLITIRKFHNTQENTVLEFYELARFRKPRKTCNQSLLCIELSVLKKRGKSSEMLFQDGERSEPPS